MRSLASAPFLAVPCLMALVLSFARAEESVEYKVKASFLYKFLQFVEWPETAFKDKDASVLIGVLGDDPFGELLEQVVRDRKVGSRSVIVRRYKDAKVAREAHVLFVGLKGDQLSSALKVLAEAHTLTVGESGAFIDSGGIVRFAVRDEKIAFDINPDAAKKADLKIASQLLRLAKIVKSKGE